MKIKKSSRKKKSLSRLVGFKRVVNSERKTLFKKYNMPLIYPLSVYLNKSCISGV